MKHKTDRDGFVTLKKGNLVARVLPESVPVWEKKGFKGVSAETAAKAETKTNDK